MKTFHISFVGRLKNAIGIHSIFNEIVVAADEKAAVLSLYNKYEHVMNVTVRES